MARTQSKPALIARNRPGLEALEERSLFSTLTVTSLQDSGVGTLRAQIAAAQSGDTIVFASTLFSSAPASSSTTSLSFPLRTSSAKVTGSGKQGHGNPHSPPPPPPPPPPPVNTITLTSGELLVNKDLTIQGPSTVKLSIGGSGHRALEVAPAATVTLSGLTIGGTSIGYASFQYSGSWEGYGGGILNHGTLTVSSCTVIGSISGYDTEGGGIFSDGTLFLNNSTVSNCYASGTSTRGAGISNWGTATLTNTIISNNMNQPSAATSYPWFNAGGGIRNRGTMTLNGCTVTGNSAREAGGAIFNDGTLILDSSRITGNGADRGGGVYNSGMMTVQNFNNLTGNGYADDIDNVGTLLDLDHTSTIGGMTSVEAFLSFDGT